MDHAHLCGSLHLRGSQRFPLHLLTVGWLDNDFHLLVKQSLQILFSGFYWRQDNSNSLSCNEQFVAHYISFLLVLFLLVCVKTNTLWL